MLDRKSILAVNDLVIEPVEVPEWGGQVNVRLMSGAGREIFESLVSEAKEEGKPNIRAILAICTVCDDAGKLLFTKEDVSAVASRSWKALDRIFDVSRKLNGIGASEVKDAEKNS